MDDGTFNLLKKKLAIAISGGIASGKSTVCQYLSQKGFLIVDADDLSKQVVLPGTNGYQEIKAHFGDKAFFESGAINRAYLRELIFNDSREKIILEGIIHPKIQTVHKTLVENFYDDHHPSIWFYAAALIFEKKLGQEFKEVWLIDCPENVQIERLTKRDHISEKSALNAIAAQMPRTERKKLASIIIDSDCSYAQLEEQIDFYLNKAINSLQKKGT